MRFEIKKSGLGKERGLKSYTLFFTARRDANARPQVDIASLELDHVGPGEIYVKDISTRHSVAVAKEFMRRFRTSPARMLILHAVKDLGSEFYGATFSYGNLSREGRAMMKRLIAQGLFQEGPGSNFSVPREKVRAVKQLDIELPSARKEHIAAIFNTK